MLSHNYNEDVRHKGVGKRIVWNLEEEIAKVIEKGVAVGLESQMGSKLVWDLEVEVAKLHSGKAVVGIIIWDYKGTTVAVKSSPVLGYSLVEMLEAQACFEGLQLAIDVGISNVS
ncbi:hypothetical protein Q3G72_017122 [Acer saccharum]|nr:hypothetical protein Q3G72_017122 [Acer saccharum]